MSLTDYSRGSIPLNVPGTIGAQKIWNRLKSHLTTLPPSEVLKQTIEEIKLHTKQIQALNLGLSDSINFYAYTLYDQHPEYYQLHSGIAHRISFIVSEAMVGFLSHQIAPDIIVDF